MNLLDAASADGGDVARPLDDAVMALISETILASSDPVASAFDLAAAAAGMLRGTIGNLAAAAALGRFMENALHGHFAQDDS